MIGKKQDKYIEDLLKSSSLEVADDGFSEKVLADLKAYQRRRLFILAPFIALGFFAVFLFFPYGIFETLPEFITNGFEKISSNLLLAILAAAMALVFWFTEKEA